MGQESRKRTAPMENTPLNKTHFHNRSNHTYQSEGTSTQAHKGKHSHQSDSIAISIN